MRVKSTCVGLFICVVCVQGRIHQIEYAMEAVKQGSATVGLKSRSHAVLVALKVLSHLCYTTSLIPRTVYLVEESSYQSPSTSNPFRNPC